MNLSTIATCSLNQWALDFTGNYNRIKASILEAKRKNAQIRVGSELEIPGYSCQDHFLEGDTVNHSWEVLAKLIADKDLYEILIFTSM
ncbi:putative glutamine-dependent NAD(+) synthetase [Smittium culicis]|uniref:NAD(+) synthase [glutamine-hydrolyzing] n=1 Tax=Smittium culicis TaxID=133412 RepID=A0A1R1YB40_9FUNG|nr:putative glutamine-dependent NAD(+) synthetase [Smittium culicis]